MSGSNDNCISTAIVTLNTKAVPHGLAGRGDVVLRLKFHCQCARLRDCLCALSRETNMSRNTIMAMRRRIERIVSRQQRVNILSRLGCLKYTGGRGRRVEICRNLQGRELISAIDNFDRACLWETKKNIELAGQRLISLW